MPVGTPIPVGERFLVEKEGKLFEFGISAIATPDLALIWVVSNEGKIERRWIRKDELAKLLEGAVLHEIFMEGRFAVDRGAIPKFAEPVEYDKEGS